MAMSHGAAHSPADLADPAVSRSVAETLQALATASRLRILAHLHEGPSPVNEIAVAVEMEPSAVSHQLRVLRTLGLVVGERHGREIHYELYDEHVAQLLTEAMSHVEHLRLGLAGRAERELAEVA
jgi:ArsR family transcriptional regulator, nickel/cobalt-responsive transcriptional repressor